MRTKEEVGYFPDFNKKSNLAYQTYASIYLDYVDDNWNHFHGRDQDLYPIRDVNWNDDEAVFNAYIKAGIDIAKQAIEHDSECIDDIFNSYPLLEAFVVEIVPDRYPCHNSSYCPYADLYAGQENEQEMCHECCNVKKVSEII